MDLRKRKRIRLKDYDYSNPGVYFVTVCIKDRKSLLWDNVGATSGRHKQVRLSKYGKFVDDAIRQISNHYPTIKINNYAVMSDHIHLLLSIEGDVNGRPVVAPTISTVINQMKGYVSKQVGYSIWQKSFVDHIIRNEKDYIEHFNYIENNPYKVIYE